MVCNGDSGKDLSSCSQRNEDKFLFEGEVLGKGRLVLAVIRKYVSMHLGISFESLKEVFPDGLQGSRLGVIARREVGEDLFRKQGHKRYFLAETEGVRLGDGDVVVCNQWGSGNFPGMLAKLAQYKLQIQVNQS